MKMDKRYLLLISFQFCLLWGINAQVKTIFKSDSLIVCLNEDNQPDTAIITRLIFSSAFNDTIQLILNHKRIFSRYINTEKGTAREPYIDIRLKKGSTLTIKFLHEKFYLTTKMISGYNFLYLYKQNKKLTLYYKNEQLIYE